MAKKTDYKTELLEYLYKNAGKDISRTALMKELGISASYLSEILTSIKSNGYTIIAPKRSKTIRFEPTEDQTLLPAIKDYDIRRWFIIFLLTKFKKLTFIELITKIILMYNLEFDSNKTFKGCYDNDSLICSLRTDYPFDDLISIASLRNDLEFLRNQGIITMRHSRNASNKTGIETIYQLSDNKAIPHIIIAPYQTLYNDFCANPVSAIDNNNNLLQQLHTRIKHLMDYESDSDTKYFGRITDISADQKEAFNNFITHNYRNSILSITTEYNESSSTTDFATGLIFYSQETGCFYALGRNTSTKLIETRRLDRITSISDTTAQNKEFESEEINIIYNEMFSAAYENESYKVKVLFQEYGNILKRFNSLKDARPTATIRKLEAKPDDCEFDYVYEDTIRGLSSFAAYLRSFGGSVLVLEPLKLKQQMINTYKKIIKEYEDLNEQHR